MDLDADLDDPDELDDLPLPDVAAEVDDVDRLVEALLAGQVVVLPTDTVYGIGALPGDRTAMEAVFAAKGRGQDAPMAVLCASVLQALSLVDPSCHERVERVAARWWPGPLTLVLPRRADVELHLGQPEHTVGVRVPDHPLVRAVTERVGPIAVSSANRHGQPTAVTAEEVGLALGASVSVVIDGGPLEGTPSTVIDATGDEWRVLREGPLPVTEIIHPGEQPLL
ncbi:MAG: L-threonylcarbamoyladenylate synthase [Actinomycetota bacterium]|nr:L-threonylcarbamoyladenylate synthase [Actinomycetota bacterium]